MKEKFLHLNEYCGHHCGAIQVGGAGIHVGHCKCPECHGNKDFIGRTEFSTNGKNNNEQEATGQI